MSLLLTDLDVFMPMFGHESISRFPSTRLFFSGSDATLVGNPNLGLRGWRVDLSLSTAL